MINASAKITWARRRYAPRLEDRGHTAVQFASGTTLLGYPRAYVRCQCGRVLSSRGQSAYQSWLRHMRRAIAETIKKEEAV